MDTLSRHAAIAEGLATGRISPGVAIGAQRAQCSSATEFRARKIYRQGLAAFRNNLLDAADLSPVMRDELLRFYRELERIAPTHAQWDAAMAAREGGQ